MSRLRKGTQTTGAAGLIAEDDATMTREAGRRAIALSDDQANGPWFEQNLCWLDLAVVA
jgi:hypothetical protein